MRRWLEPNGRLKVLSTTAMIADIVEQVGGDRVDVLTLISGGLDPHSYQLVKGDDEKIMAADLILYNGLDLEHGPSLKRHLVGNAGAVAIGDWLWARDANRIVFVDDLPDPHIWMDMSLWAEGVDAVVESLTQHLPQYRQELAARGKAVQQGLLETHRQLRRDLMAVPDERRYLVTSHDAFHYFARAYLATEQELLDGSWQERCAAPEGLAPESMLSAADIQEIIDHLSRHRIEVLFSESNVNQDSIRKIVDAGREKGLNIRIADCFLYGDAMGCPGSEGETYQKMLQHNVRCITEQLLREGDDGSRSRR